MGLASTDARAAAHIGVMKTSSVRNRILAGLTVSLLALGVTGCESAGQGIPPAVSAPVEAVTPTVPVTPSAAPVLPAPPAPAPKPAEPAKAPPEVSAGTALAQLETITIKGRAPKTGYSRDMFGPAWPDLDNDGCDERNETLARDLTNLTYKDGRCVIATGMFADPYTGKTISFVRGTKTSSAVQIDHVVALSDAWQKGAQQLNSGQRMSLANDPLNLLASDGPANGSKSDSDAASWLPSNKGFRCEYVARQTSVKAKYQLWMTQAEHDAVARVLATCPDEPAAGAGSTNTPVTNAAPVPVTPESEPAAAPAAPAAGESVAYANCAAVRAAGAAPIRAGDPGYAKKLDRDGDGVGCE